MTTEGKGLVPPHRRQAVVENESVSAKAETGQVSIPEPKVGHVKEYGLSVFISTHCTELAENLKRTPPDVEQDLGHG